MGNYENLNRSGLVFDIQRFSIHDGPGIRTLVFLKGCPMRCSWCSNPEGQIMEKELLYNTNWCITCGRCVEVCSHKASTLEDVKIVFNRTLCIECGQCVSVCPSGARTVSGSWMKVSTIMKIIEKDEAFYRHSGGGVTLGGGEPAYQPAFARALLDECRRCGIHTAVETCGYAQWETLYGVLKSADLVFYDIKHIDDEKHIRNTGVSNSLILENFERLLKTSVRVIVRVTLIPCFNDSESDRNLILGFIRAKGGDVQLEYLHYHGYGIHKYELLGRRYQYECTKIYGSH
ncbi:MAG: glycyl-radical enzyme activating protein [Thermodesulfovibrionales bacterium]